MTGKRRSFGSAFKAKVGLAACRGDKRTAQLAAEFSVHQREREMFQGRLIRSTMLMVVGSTLSHGAGPDCAVLPEVALQCSQCKRDL